MVWNEYNTQIRELLQKTNIVFNYHSTLLLVKTFFQYDFTLSDKLIH